jgi:hypothetical protein
MMTLQHRVFELADDSEGKRYVLCIGSRQYILTYVSLSLVEARFESGDDYFWQANMFVTTDHVEISTIAQWVLEQGQERVLIPSATELPTSGAPLFEADNVTDIPADLLRPLPTVPTQPITERLDLKILGDREWYVQNGNVDVVAHYGREARCLLFQTTSDVMNRVQRLPEVEEEHRAFFFAPDLILLSALTEPIMNRAANSLATRGVLASHFTDWSSS